MIIFSATMIFTLIHSEIRGHQHQNEQTS